MPLIFTTLLNTHCYYIICAADHQELRGLQVGGHRQRALGGRRDIHNLVSTVIHMRKFTRLAETRLAQNSLHYINIA